MQEQQNIVDIEDIADEIDNKLDELKHKIHVSVNIVLRRNEDAKMMRDDLFKSLNSSYINQLERCLNEVEALQLKTFINCWPNSMSEETGLRIAEKTNCNRP